jgi:hypothetical protein
MAPSLVYESVDVNERSIVETLVSAARTVLSRADSWHRLEVRSGRYFATPDGPLPDGPGWYVIGDRTGAARYVGEAGNLNARLNSDQGSLDNFANSNRASDPIRNFLKIFVSNGLLGGPRVGLIEEAEMLSALTVRSALSARDRCNVEKVLAVFRDDLLIRARAPGEERA